jgi:hypothetical protein
MPYVPLLYEFLPLYLAQAALTVWMLVDANRRGVDYYWFWIILAFQPLGAWAYFFLYKVQDFRGGAGWPAGLFHRRPSLEEVRHRAEWSPTLANRLELGGRLVEAGEFAEARPHFEAVLAHEPEHGQALFLLAACHRGLGHPVQALALLEKLKAHQPNWGNYSGWHTLIAVRREAGDAAGAIASCRELLQTAPRLEHTCLLADHLLDAGEREEAGKILRQALADFRYLPGPSRRRDRPCIGKAKQLLKEIRYSSSGK